MQGVLAEHHGYLALNGRLDRYDDALARVISPGDVVADLGCGFGVLGILAIKAGAVRVYGIDESDAIEIARETMARAGLDSEYECIRQSTFRATLPQAADLIICDHVGYFGIDYGIVEMLADARRRLLKPGGNIMPQRLELMLAGASSENCLQAARCWEVDPIPAEFRWLREYALNSKHKHAFDKGDLCSDAASLGIIDLRADNPACFTFNAKLAIAHDCRFDGVAGWFNCELADGVWMTNSPIAPVRIARPQIFLPCTTPFDVKAGDVVDVSIKMLHASETITWTITDPATGRKHRQSTWNSRILTQGDLLERDGGSLLLNPDGIARQIILQLVDGVRTMSEIAKLVLETHPELFPSDEECNRFIQRELGRNTQS